MKYIFTMNGHTYFAPTSKEAKNFLHFWGGELESLNQFKTTWDVQHIERAPKWVPEKLDLTAIEYKR